MKSSIRFALVLSPLAPMSWAAAPPTRVTEDSFFMFGNAPTGKALSGRLCRSIRHLSTDEKQPYQGEPP